MISFFVGDDIKKREAAYGAALKKATGKGGVSVHHFDDLSWNPVAFEQVLGGSSFFDERSVVVLRGVATRAETIRELVELKEVLLGSQHEIFWIEESLSKEIKKVFEKKKGVEMFLYELSSQKIDKSPLVFPTAEAYVRGDKKGAWLGLMQMARAGVSGEEFFWGLSWKIKDTLGKIPEGPRREKLVDLSRKSVVAYHESKRGGASLDEALEAIALSL